MQIHRYLPLISLLTACALPPSSRAPEGAPSEEAAQTRAARGDVWIDCYRTFRPEEDPSTDVSRLARACGKPSGLSPLGGQHMGEQTSKDKVERLSFRARRGRCYRLLAVGAPDVTDLDVAVLDATGQLIAADLSRDRFSVVPPRGPLCVDRDEVLTIQVAVVAGEGAYALEILSNGPPAKAAQGEPNTTGSASGPLSE